jgi:predicted phage terminase large subunit-like protein
MQIPSPLAGGIMKPDNITIIPALPMGIVEFVRGWDFAASTKGDFTAGAKIGVLPDGRWLIADMVRIRVSPDERDAALVNTANRDGDNCRISIPQDPGQAGLTQVKYLVRSLSGFSVKATPESGNKVVRAEPFAAQVNVGNVVMLKADWNDALISEMRMFPNGTFDDQVDALSRAFSMLITNEPSQIFIPDVGKPINPLQARILKEMPGLPSAVVDAIQIPSGMFCGNCSAYVAGQCADRGFLVGERDVGCDSFINK